MKPSPNWVTHADADGEFWAGKDYRRPVNLLLLLLLFTNEVFAHGSSHPKWRWKTSVDGVEYGECRNVRYAPVNFVRINARVATGLFTSEYKEIVIDAVPVTHDQFLNLRQTKCKDL